MDCLKSDVPINIMVQTLFAARNAPGLRRLRRIVCLHHAGAEMEIVPDGAVFRLPRIGTLRASYDVIPDRARLGVLTLALTDNSSATSLCEATRLDAQSRILQPLISGLEADETHWHLLPGPVDRTGERHLARRAADHMRRPVLSNGSAAQNKLLFTLAGKNREVERRSRPARTGPFRPMGPIAPANDLPALPPLRHDRIGSVLDDLADSACPARGFRLTFEIGTARAVIMSRYARV